MNSGIFIMLMVFFVITFILFIVTQFMYEMKRNKLEKEYRDLEKNYKLEIKEIREDYELRLEEQADLFEKDRKWYTQKIVDLQESLESQQLYNSYDEILKNTNSIPKVKEMVVERDLGEDIPQYINKGAFNPELDEDLI